MTTLKAATTRQLASTLRDRLVESIPFSSLRGFLGTSSPSIVESLASSAEKVEIEATPAFIKGEHAVWAEIRNRSKFDQFDKKKELEKALEFERASRSVTEAKLASLESEIAKTLDENKQRAAQERLQQSLELKSLKCSLEESTLKANNLTEMVAKQKSIIAELQQERPRVATIAAENCILHQNDTIDVEKNDHHSLYGKLVCDLGFKRVYATNVSDLLNIPTWEKQRVFKRDRARKIAREKLKKSEEESGIQFPGVITLFENEEKNGVIDGQHRIGALSVLLREEHISPDQQVLTEVIQVNSEKAVENLFLEINKSEPIKLVDLPGMSSQAERKILNAAAEELALRFPKMFKPSSRCRVPHMNSDNLRDRCFQVSCHSYLWNLFFFPKILMCSFFFIFDINHFFLTPRLKL